jgi:hypothetical protein
MQFQDIDDGQYRIHAGSLEIRAGEGHIAAVIVNRSSNGKNKVLEVFRDIDIQSGYRWPTSDQALQRALVLGASAVSAERLRAARYSSDYAPA